MGIIVGAMALFVVLSVFSGLKVLVFRLPMISTGFKNKQHSGKSFFVSPEQDAQIKKLVLPLILK
jgi:lipoprotein-releasing system permease protein